MHEFLHGIRRSVLAAWGLPCLPPLQLFFGGRELQDEADQNRNLQPHYKEGHKEKKPEDDGAENRDLQSKIDGQIDGFLPPQRGEDENKAANIDLQRPEIKGHEYEGFLPPQRGEEQGTLQPMNYEDEDAVKKDLRIMEANQLMDKDHRLTNEEILPMVYIWYDGHLFIVQNLDSQYVIAADMHVQSACINDGAALNYPPKFPTWVMPSPRPRVKMKSNLQQQHDAHAWKHDAWVSSTSPSDSSIPIKANLFIDGIPSRLLPLLRGSTTSHDDKPRTSSIPFTLLRGREFYQAHERNFKSENPHAALKTKTMVMKMRLFYINKDLHTCNTHSM